MIISAVFMLVSISYIVHMARFWRLGQVQTALSAEERSSRTANQNAEYEEA